MALSPKMLKYLLLIKISLQDLLEHRFDLVVQTIRYSVNLMLISLIWIGIEKQRGGDGTSIPTLLSYFMICSTIYSLSNFHTDAFENEIRLGSLSKYLVKPISSYWFYGISCGVKNFAELTIRTVVFLPAVLWMHGATGWTFPNILLFLLALPVIYLSMFSLYFAISCLTFWFDAIESLRISIMFFFRFFSGIFMPLIFLPEATQLLLKKLPFALVAHYPIALLQGQLTVEEGFFFFIKLVFWLCCTFSLAQLIWTRGTHSYTATGG